MSKLAWTPWHQVVEVRGDLKSGELSLAIFAADIYEVMMGKAKPVYRDPAEFFALTYPTFNLRELAKDVLTRLAGKNEKAVRQLELTYGGGKTHSLITLFHLVSDPDRLPKLPAVNEFIQHVGLKPPKARVAVLAFDKLDVEKGMEVRGPDGTARWLKNPWSVLAFQIAGAEGLKLLNAEGKDAERESPPAENLLVELLGMPRKEGLATLILIDEVLMYARGKVGLDPAWRGRLIDFFQYLTQAATKVDSCAIVASLLATDPSKSDALGKELTQELYAIFRREREEGVQPVVKEDVAEVLRRRFFTAESIKDREAYRPHVVAALKGISDLDEQTRKDGKAAEERYLKSYPFHPDLTDVFYSKWTQLEGFQRTRGILRTFALALREAERWDESPLVAANAFLCDPGRDGVSEAARELTTVAATEEYEGKNQEWTGILDGELGKARKIQSEAAGLRYREIEQAVLATFLHSQPVGQKALTRELLSLLGHTRPDKIELEKGLFQWTEASWFLDEGAIGDAEAGPDGRKQLPKVWRLGSKPNLRQMHHDACDRISVDLVEAKLLGEIQRLKNLTAGASAAGARVHNLPEKPRDIEDDGEFHYAVLGPKAASESGKPSPEARRFLDETTAADRPRVFRNSVVLAVPSKDGLEIVKNRIRDYLGWEEVRSQLKDQELDAIREGTLAVYLEEARKKVPESIQQAYSIVVTVSDKNEIQGFKIAVSGEPLFQLIKNDSRSRIQETAVSAEALLPDGPYNLWRPGEKSRRVKDLVGAFAQFPHLPKMLNRKAIQDTLVGGCVQGTLVLQLVRPDKTVRTFWHEEPDEATLKDPSLEVVLPQAATLAPIPPGLLALDRLPGLWDGRQLPVKTIKSYFGGGRVVKAKRDGYEDSVAIPKADPVALESAVGTAVKDGILWLVSGPASLLSEEIPAGLLTDDAVLLPPPEPISSLDLLPEKLPEAWSSDVTTALTIAAALSKRANRNLPWASVRSGIDGAFRSGLLERTADSGVWPCDLAGAQNVRIRVLATSPREVLAEAGPGPGVFWAEASLRPNQIQDLADHVADIAKAAVGLELKFNVRVELGGSSPPPDKIVEKISSLLADVDKTLRLRK